MKRKLFIVGLLMVLCMGAYPLLQEASADSICQQWCLDNFSGSPQVLTICQNNCVTNNCDVGCSLACGASPTACNQCLTCCVFGFGCP
ncbi:MAG TPA: hypothetical protein VLV83_17440 [Acidobacteriota bacterium]|nr:hypothetical protein [Acidobacteriota bacterium]